MIKTISILFFALHYCIISLAQVNEFKVMPSVGSEGDGFGWYVSIDGEYAIVGTHSGEKAFIFKRSGINRTEQEILTGNDNPPSSVSSPLFGYSVYILGDYAIIGAAYIFKRSNEHWILQQMIPPPVEHPFGLFGWSVAISNSFAIVGEADRNIIHIYGCINENWKLDTTLADGWRFGEYVAISDNYVLAGSFGGIIFNTDGQGSASIFLSNGVDWIKQAVIKASDGTDIDGFGEALSISNTNLIAGDKKAKNSDSVNTGAAYIFNHNDSAWIETQKLTARDGSSGDLFGSSVSIYGNIAIVSAPEDQDNGIKSGSAYIFMNDGANWKEVKKLLASDGTANNNFGSSVSVSVDYIIVGAKGEDVYGIGSAYIYSNFITDVINNHSSNPFSFNLSQNYPNPFNPTTKIKYEIPKTSFVAIKVYDVLGRKIKTLVSEEKQPGKYKVDFDGSNLLSGVYFYKLQAGSYTKTKKMVIIK